MIKKAYQQPTVKVVKIQHQTHLLAGSGPATLNGSKDGDDDPEWKDLG